MRPKKQKYLSQLNEVTCARIEGWFGGKQAEIEKEKDGFTVLEGFGSDEKLTGNSAMDFAKNFRLEGVSDITSNDDDTSIKAMLDEF